MQTKKFEVPNISCGHCVMTIKNELSDLAGVTKVEADRETRMVTVEWQEPPATWEQIKNRLVEINYPPAPGTN
ncbi:MAG: copper chaperone [Planctomycetaceae bacterium]|nr:MAG: copper chaperone [Planctomycetaceae bacterium]